MTYERKACTSCTHCYMPSPFACAVCAAALKRKRRRRERGWWQASSSSTLALEGEGTLQGRQEAEEEGGQERRGRRGKKGAGAGAGRGRAGSGGRRQAGARHTFVAEEEEKRQIISAREGMNDIFSIHFRKQKTDIPSPPLISHHLLHIYISSISGTGRGFFLHCYPFQLLPVWKDSSLSSISGSSTALPVPFSSCGVLPFSLVPM